MNKENLVINFEEGIYGFEDLKEFVFYKTDENNSPLTIMQFHENPNISFLLIPPNLIELDYEIELDAADISDLEIESKEEVVVLSILTISKGKNISVNLKSPIVFSLKSKLGKQIIFEDSKYETRHKVPFSKMES